MFIKKKVALLPGIAHCAVCQVYLAPHLPLPEPIGPTGVLTDTWEKSDFFLFSTQCYLEKGFVLSPCVLPRPCTRPGSWVTVTDSRWMSEYWVTIDSVPYPPVTTREEGEGRTEQWLYRPGESGIISLGRGKVARRDFQKRSHVSMREEPPPGLPTIDRKELCGGGGVHPAHQEEPEGGHRARVVPAQ